MTRQRCCKVVRTQYYHRMRRKNYLASCDDEAWLDETSEAMLRNPCCTRKSHTRLVLFTSILTSSRASRRRSLPPRRAYSRTRVSFTTRYGLGRMRSWAHSTCSAGESRCSEGLFARLRGTAAIGYTLVGYGNGLKRTHAVYGQWDPAR